MALKGVNDRVVVTQPHLKVRTVHPGIRPKLNRRSRRAEHCGIELEDPLIERLRIASLYPSVFSASLAV